MIKTRLTSSYQIKKCSLKWSSCEPCWVSKKRFTYNWMKFVCFHKRNKKKIFDSDVFHWNLMKIQVNPRIVGMLWQAHERSHLIRYFRQINKEWLHSCQLIYSLIDIEITYLLNRRSNFHVELNFFLGWQTSASWIKRNVWWYENKTSKEFNLIHLFEPEIDYDMSSRHPYDHWNVSIEQQSANKQIFHVEWIQNSYNDWCTAWFWQTWKEYIFLWVTKWKYGSMLTFIHEPKKNMFLMFNIWYKNQTIKMNWMWWNLVEINRIKCVSF